MEATITKPSPETAKPEIRMPSDDRLLRALSLAERATALSLTLHHLAHEAGQANLADIAWVTHLEIREAVESLSSALGLAPDLD